MGGRLNHDVEFSSGGWATNSKAPPTPCPADFDPHVSLPFNPISTCHLHCSRFLVVCPPILKLLFFPFADIYHRSMADSSSHRLDLRVGGKYRLGKKIGSGSFGGHFAILIVRPFHLIADQRCWSQVTSTLGSTSSPERRSV